MKRLATLLVATLFIWATASWAEIIACQGSDGMPCDANLFVVVYNAIKSDR